MALDQAKTFYELFNLTPKELLSSVVERGAVFRELDYMNALQLLHRSNLLEAAVGLLPAHLLHFLPLTCWLGEKYKPCTGQNSQPAQLVCRYCQLYKVLT